MEEPPTKPGPRGAEPAKNAVPDSGVAGTIARWQEKLLQLDRRNRLLYFREGRSAVPLAETTPEEVSEWLDSAPTRRWRFVELDEGRPGREPSSRGWTSRPVRPAGVGGPLSPRLVMRPPRSP